MVDPNESRKRRMEANYWISQGDPGRFAPQVSAGLERFHNAAYGTNAALDRQRAAELEMAKQQGINAIGAEEAKARGLERQGMEAARIKGAADVQVAGINAGSAKARFGWFDDDGTYHPGSDAMIAENNNRATLEQSRLERESRLEGINAKGKWDKEIEALKAANGARIAQIGAGATVAAATEKAGAMRDQASIRAEAALQAKRSRIVQDIMKGNYLGNNVNSMSPEQWKKMSPEQQEAFIRGLL